VLFIVVVIVGVVVVFFLVLAFVFDVNFKVGCLVLVVVFICDVLVYESVGADDFELVEVFSWWLLRSVIIDVCDVVGLVLFMALPKGMYV